MRETNFLNQLKIVTVRLDKGRPNNSKDQITRSISGQIIKTLIIGIAF
ncbi:MAG: hypothetical protein ACJ700_03395 [Nitrososphaera sp.]